MLQRSHGILREIKENVEKRTEFHFLKRKNKKEFLNIKNMTAKTKVSVKGFEELSDREKKRGAIRERKIGKFVDHF